jgi:heme oxygenase
VERPSKFPFEDLPEVGSLGQALGCLYVMEGSTLGGRFIARRLHEHLGLTPASGAAFFHGYGEETGSRWKAFQQALVRYSAATENEFAVIGAAEETFSKFEKWLNH